MAILFQCPSCAAQIRVPDAAAGKKGTCPQCGVKLLVPTLPEMTPHSAEPSAPPIPADPAPFPVPVDSPPVDDVPVAPPPEFANLEANPFGGTTTPSIALQLKKRRRARRKGGLWLPLLCGAAFVGVVAWFYWESTPRLEGTLVGTVLDSPDLYPAYLPAKGIEVDPATRKKVLDDLKDHPARPVGPLMELTLRGSPEGLEVEVAEGKAAQFVRISPLRDAALLQYHQQHAASLDERRRAALAEGLKKFFRTWSEYIDQSDLFVDFASYTESVALPALVSGLGHHVEAIAGNRRYLCVYEDTDGNLYFLLPPGTQAFQLQGRDINGEIVFPGKYTVTVANEKTKLKAPLRPRSSGEETPPSRRDLPPLQPLESS